MRIEPAPEVADEDLVRVDDAAAAALFGRFIDLARTDTLANDVFLHRGRLTDPGAPWTDPASSGILLQYSHVHLAAAWAHAARSDERSMQRHLERAEWWRARP
jgi:hypothetical protein